MTTQLRIQFEARYSATTSGGQVWYYTVVSDAQNQIGYRDVTSPQGPVRDGFTVIPQEITEAIQQSILQVRSVLVATSAISGQLSFAGETEKTVNFSPPLADSNYRVHIDAPDFINTRVRFKATTGFVVELGSTYTGTIGYDVFT